MPTKVFGRVLLGAVAALIVSSETSWADGPYALITGRRDPRVIVVDLAKAMDPANNGTAKGRRYR